MEVQWNWLSEGAPRTCRLERAAEVKEKSPAEDFEETWAEIQKVMWEALAPYPEARVAIAAALLKLSGDSGGSTDAE